MPNESLPEMFTDGISNLEISNGMVRIDFYSLSSKDKDSDGTPTKIQRQRLVMSPQGFLESFSTMQSMFQKLEEAGILQRNDNSEPTSGETAPTKSKKKAKSTNPKSPNFD